MTLDELPENPKPKGWETGRQSFRCPLVIAFNSEGDNFYDDFSWKSRLSGFFGGLTGEDLSRAVVAGGYDGIVTVRAGEVSEIVDLTMF